ncbi:Protein of unknown function [Seinonella peptonophila]|uniref:DUF3221 domain-containing protein n=1 Tax=Seinonella peptonophila TaxID=112248 RepID=A0A1M4XIA0_9BACL|nr:DUF3221 domain-containing protein [Seinonella peptonophila]SHE93229.1 Protein of unknown function [Seinonella peptonophila]
MFIKKKIILFQLCACLLLFSLTACTSTADQVQPPVEQSNIRGTVTKIEGDRIFVEEDPNEQTVSAKADIELGSDTKYYIKQKAGYQEGKKTDINQGKTVDVWFTGITKDSFPLEAKASHVVVDLTSENK